MPKSTNFAALMEDNYNPIKRINLFRQASREEKFVYLFDKNQLPTIGAWYVSGEILIWVLWCFWLLFNAVIWLMGGAPNLVVDSLLIRGDLLDYNWGMIETVFIFLIGCAGLFALLPFLLIFGTYLYPFLSLPIWLAKKTKKIAAFWFLLLLWAAFCFQVAVWVGWPVLIGIFTDGVFDVVRATWLDAINPDYNSLMLILGYPVAVFILGCALIINILYYKYKPQIDSDKNWSAEGLDSHLLDGDADN